MAEILNEQNNNVAKEVKLIIEWLTNENVKGNQDRQLDVWCLIFSRLLRTDGMRMLCSHNEMRFNVKQRAHEGLIDCPNNQIIDIATKINDFIYRVEIMGLGPEDIHEEQL